MVNILEFNGHSSLEFGVNVASKSMYDGSEADLSVQEVPGRNGDIVFSNGRRKNVSVTYTLMWRRSVLKKMIGLRNWLSANTGKYCRLEDSYDPEIYRLGFVSGSLNPSIFKNSSGSVDVTFSCKPQRFLKSGEEKIVLAQTANLFNPGSGNALPLIRVYGKGTLTIGDYIVEVKKAGSNYIDIDCERMSAYEDGNYRDNCISVRNGSQNYVFPVIPSGEFEVQLNGITKIELTPRWWSY